jgi:4-hydroxybenzoate polyprenyltransferase
MTFEKKKLALMVAWVVTVLLCGAIVSMTSGAGWVAVLGLALVPAAVVYRLFTESSRQVPQRIQAPRRITSK